MKTVTKEALAVGAIGVPLGVLFLGILNAQVSDNLTTGQHISRAALGTALPTTIVAETLAIKYQNNKFLWLNAIPLAVIAVSVSVGLAGKQN